MTKKGVAFVVDGIALSHHGDLVSLLPWRQQSVSSNTSPIFDIFSGLEVSRELIHVWNQLRCNAQHHPRFNSKN